MSWQLEVTEHLMFPLHRNVSFAMASENEHEDATQHPA